MITRASIGAISKSLGQAEDHSRYGSRSIVDRTVLGLPLIVLIQVLESGRIGPSLIDTAFQTACQTDVSSFPMKILIARPTPSSTGCVSSVLFGGTLWSSV